MPSKARGYYPGFRFPPNRIKKMMQKDDEVGKVAQPVPVMLSRALELFTTQLLRSAGDVADLRGARTLTPSHLATVIQSDPKMDFLRTLVEKVPRAEDTKTPGEEVIKKPARGAKTLTPSEVAAAIEADPRMEFVQSILGKVETSTTFPTSPHGVIKTSPTFKTSPHGGIKTSQTSPWKQPATDFSIQTLLSPVKTPANNLYNLYEIPANKIPANKIPGIKIPAIKIPANKIPSNETPANKISANKTPANRTAKAGGKTQGLEARPSPAFQLSAKSLKTEGNIRQELEAPAPASLPCPPAFQLSFPAELDEDYDAF